MPLRTFRSSAGVVWRVWSVIPGIRNDAERRTGYDRRSPDPVLRFKGEERRSGGDRRGEDGLIPAELKGGWLTFETEAEKRRLAPIPPGWDRLPDAALEQLCGRALVVPPVPPPAPPR